MKKKSAEKTESNAEDDIQVVDNTPKLYMSYVAKLEQEFGECSSGASVDATLMPLCVDRKTDKWENKWFIHVGDKFIGMLPKDSKALTIISTKKGKK